MKPTIMLSATLVLALIITALPSLQLNANAAQSRSHAVAKTQYENFYNKLQKREDKNKPLADQSCAELAKSLKEM